MERIAMSAIKKYRSPKISIPVDDVDVGLDEFKTSDLLTELKHRGSEAASEIMEPIEAALFEVREYLFRGRVDDALLALDRVLRPKWRSAEQCLADFASLKATGETVNALSNEQTHTEIEP